MRRHSRTLWRLCRGEEARTAVLAKLGAPSRIAAAAEAVRLGLVGAAGEDSMPLYMDVHTIAGGVGVDDVTKAHMTDLQTQGKYDMRYLRYWVDETQGKVFCLVEAPSADAAAAVHREAHGFVAQEVFQVQEGS
jgi:Protein of unknown function (DUF4242)